MENGVGAFLHDPAKAPRARVFTELGAGAGTGAEHATERPSNQADHVRTKRFEGPNPRWWDPTLRDRPEMRLPA